MHSVPERPWQKVGTDILTFKGRSYLITVDYFSQFFELDLLIDTTAETVIETLKQHFARHGAPDVVISDNGPPYSSIAFARFAREWCFSHEPMSPGNSQSNGTAEAAVKTAKAILTKSHAAGEDHMIGLLNIRNTPQEGLTTSPAQRLFGRRTRTLIPCSSVCLKPAASGLFDNERRRLEDKKANIAQQYIDRRELPTLRVGDTVRMQPINNTDKQWREATVSKTLPNRSYEVTNKDGRKYRRSRVFLRSAHPSTHHRSDSSCVTNTLPYNVIDNTTGTGRDLQFHANLEPSDHPPPPCSTPQPAPVSEHQPEMGTPATPVTSYTTKSGRMIKQRDILDL